MSYEDDLRNLQEQMKNYMERLNTGRLSNRDSGLMVQIAGSYYEVLEKYQKQEQEKPETAETIAALNNVLNKISAFQDSIIKSDVKEIKAAFKDISETLDNMVMEAQKKELLMAIFRTDLKEMELHEAKLKSLQSVVDMDIKLYGEVTKETLDVLDVQHCELGNNNLVQKKEKTVQKGEEVKALNTGNKLKPKLSGKEQSYQGSAYLKGTGEKQKPTILYGSSPEDIITTLQGWNRGRTKDMQMETCYIRKLNPETNRYENVAKYEIASGIDITPIYLNLPHMSRDKFTKAVAELKRNGAKYNPVKKAFFITKQNDLNQFAQYLPMSGTQAAVGESRSQNELSYEIESGQEYYDNRVKITVEGMEPFNVYGDDYEVHFPSLSAENTREIIEKFVLPELDKMKQPKTIAQNVTYNGRKYDPLQYDVLELAARQNFTKEQMLLLERPELSSDRLNEIRFAIKDGLSEEQIAQFATPAHEQWQMDLCRIGMQHGMSYEDIKPVIDPEGYSAEQWGERRNQLGQIIKERERELNTSLRPNLPSKRAESDKGDKDSIITKLNQNKAKLESERTDGTDLEKRERSNVIER